MPTPALTRRRVLGGAVAGLSMSGCDVAGPDPGPDRPTGPTADAAPTPDDPDAALVEEVRADLRESLALVVAAVASRPGLEPELRGFRRLHRRHLDALPGEDESSSDPRVAGDAAAVRARVRSREERLRARLADAAVASESGPLASLFASMSAAVAQQLAVPSPASGR